MRSSMAALSLIRFRRVPLAVLCCQYKFVLARLSNANGENLPRALRIGITPLQRAFERQNFAEQLLARASGQQFQFANAKWVNLFSQQSQFLGGGWRRFDEFRRDLQREPGLGLNALDRCSGMKRGQPHPSLSKIELAEV